MEQGASAPCSRIEIFDINGRIVADIPVGEGLRPFRSSQNYKTGGSETVPLRNETVIWTPNASLTSGVYFVQVRTSGESVSKKIIYLR